MDKTFARTSFDHVYLDSNFINFKIHDLSTFGSRLQGTAAAGDHAGRVSDGETDVVVRHLNQK